MYFDPDHAPPPSKYSYAEVGLQNLQLYNEDSGDEDDDGANDGWMCSSVVDYNDKQTLQSEAKKPTIQRYSAQQWLEKIEEKYFDERDDLARQCIQAALENVEDPYGFILHVIHRGFFDLYSKRVPIQYYAMDELDIWLTTKQQNGEELPPLYYSHKCQAGEFVCRKGYNYLDKMNKVFQLDQDDNSFLADYLQLEKLQCKKLKEAIHIIKTLNLHDCFSPEDLMLPLIAYDQLQVLENYIGDNIELQKEYVNFLNMLCGMKEDDIKYMVGMKELHMKDPSKLKHKTLTKIAEKAVKRYDLNPEDYHEIFEAKNIGALYHLVKMRQKEKHAYETTSPNHEKWDNLLETAVSGKKWLKIRLIQRFHELEELHDAVVWSIKLKIHPKDLPTGVAKSLQNYAVGYEHEIDIEEEEEEEQRVNSTVQQPKSIMPETLSLESAPSENLSCQESEEDWEKEIENSSPRAAFSYGFGFVDDPSQIRDDYHKLNLPIENVKVIDTIPKLEKLTKVLFTKGQVIGFDAEWKPQICRAGEQDRISILQLAAQNFVFILDLFNLYVTRGAEKPLQNFFFQFFTSEHVTKIGYGITGDLKVLMGMFSCMKDFILNSVNLVDLCEISPKIMKHPASSPFIFSTSNYISSDAKGLSLLVAQTLGKRLDKTFQVSDWERRPLSQEQIKYSALDAYCLLEVYGLFQRIVHETKIKVDLQERVKLKWLKPKATNPGKRKDKYERKNRVEKVPIDTTPLFKGPPRPSTSLRVICDTMLQGLGKQLRSCGVDTIILDNHQDHSTAIQISHRDNRAILTRGKPFFMLRGHVREGMCMWVPDGSLLEQVKMVFTRFNVALSTKDILSRCTFCNSSGYTYVPSVDMKLAFELKHDLADAEMPETQQTPSRLINLSNYALVKSETEIQLDFISQKHMATEKHCELFERVETFYVCDDCGKVYWEGSHHTAVKDNFKELIDKREEDKYYYLKPK